MDHLPTSFLAYTLICVFTVLCHAALFARARALKTPAPLLHPILAVELLEGEAARAYLRSAVLDLEIERGVSSGVSRRHATRLAKRARQALLRDPTCAPEVHERLDHAEVLLGRGADEPSAWRALSESLQSLPG